MEINEYNDEYKVFLSARDRIVKKAHDKVYEVYHITIGDDNKNMLSVSTIDFNDVNDDEIKVSLDEIGFIYHKDEAKIINKLNEQDVIIDDKKLINYVIADKLSISGHNYDTIKFEFENTNQLNELLLEHDIPIKYANRDIQYL